MLHHVAGIQSCESVPELIFVSWALLLHPKTVFYSFPPKSPPKLENFTPATEMSLNFKISFPFKLLFLK